MSRILITGHYGADPGLDNPTPAVGWFDGQRTERFPGRTRWDGSNHVGITTGDAHRGEAVQRTAGGRWVHETWSNWQGEADDEYSAMTEEQAREWLTVHGHDEAVIRHFGEVETERGPGRPAIGPPVNVRLGDALPAVDAWADRHDVSRAEAVRRLVVLGLLVDNAGVTA